jgi:starch phosphorylase
VAAFPGKVRTLHVAPALPEALSGLRTIAQNWRHTWNATARGLFRRLDPALWKSVRRDPMLFLARVEQETLRSAESDPSFLGLLHAALEDARRDQAAAPIALPEGERDLLVAYFCAEYAIAEYFQIYSGGLGVLAGDHLRSASDLRVPLIAVGLFYREGYNTQRLGSDGWQHEVYPPIDPYSQALESVRTPEGIPLMVSVELPEGPCAARIWKATIGRTQLYLLDTVVRENPAEHRQLTARLYGGDEHTRIRQEILLGIGGVRALRALGIRPSVWHMNEGHSSFLVLERARVAMEEQQLGFEAALELVRASTVFTTHTPVPAGNDAFGPEMMLRYFPTPESRCGLTIENLLALGRRAQDAQKEGASFEMTILALQGAGGRNGVSRLHGQVSRRMFRDVWEGTPEEEVPIGSITNGVHYETWLGEEMAALFSRYLARDWVQRQEDPALWAKVDEIPDEELWRARERARERLIGAARERLRLQVTRHGARPRELAAIDEMLSPDALTIGFARRMAPYKRAGLLLRDLKRIAALVGDAQRPVQILYAGKAHPRNDAGKEDLRAVFQATQREELKGRVVFLEDYDLELGRLLVQGCDLWLNTPRRPQEASGTSGMKSVLNGGIHMSILDGWWDEAYQPGLGWAIDSPPELAVVDPEDVDRTESDNLYDLLEGEVVPAFWQRSSASALPSEWIRRVKASLKAHGPRFSTHRMVREYFETFYRPAHRRGRSLAADGARGASELAAYRARLRGAFERVAILAVEEPDTRKTREVGHVVRVRAQVELGGLSEEDVAVELYLGPVDGGLEIQGGRSLPMQRETSPDVESGPLWYAGEIPLEKSGRIGYAVRVRPVHPLANGSADLLWVRWATV